MADEGDVAAPQPVGGPAGPPRCESAPYAQPTSRPRKTADARAGGEGAYLSADAPPKGDIRLSVKREGRRMTPQERDEGPKVPGVPRPAEARATTEDVLMGLDLARPARTSPRFVNHGKKTATVVPYRGVAENSPTHPGS